MLEGTRYLKQFNHLCQGRRMSEKPSPFTEKEIGYLRAQRLGRLATVGGGGVPHIVPVGFRLDAEAGTIEIGGHGLSRSKKWRDLQANPNVAFAVDDLASVDPWTPRGIEIRGRAELHDSGGQERFGGGGWDSAWFSVVPQRIISWGIEGPAFSATGRSSRSVPNP
jgi:pyridoxamine 5'-phosphate oxidase family protein